MSNSEFPKQHLLDAIANRTAKIGIIGLGYVGLPLMLAAADKGFRVLGFDINPELVNGLNSGTSPLEHIPSSSIAAVRENGRFEATFDLARLAEPDALIICVPTPLGHHREPDLRFVEATSQAIGKVIRRGQIVVLESTSYPGTTAEVCKPLIEASGLKSGHDFFLAFSPEREDPGNQHFSTAGIPKVVGGDGPAASEIACALYGSVVQKVVPVSSPEAAEAVKVTENIFRAVNIALVNELKMIYSKMGINIFEVVDAAKTKPFGYMPFYPGPGLGGHCIPIDPFYLTWKAREHGINTRFIELAGEINSDMPDWVLGKLALALDEKQGKSLSRSKLLVIGAAYKKNISDMRESPALVIMEKLIARGAQVTYHDPHVPVIPMTREHASLAGHVSVPLDEATLPGYDAAIIVTDHDKVDWALLARLGRLIVDTRYVMARHGLTSDNIVNA